MSFFDWAIIICYMICMIIFIYFVGRNQTTKEDYFVGDRKLPWWNFFGFVVSVVTTLLIGLFSKPVASDYVLKGETIIKDLKEYKKLYLMLLGYFFVILIFILTVGTIREALL